MNKKIYLTLFLAFLGSLFLFSNSSNKSNTQDKRLLNYWQDGKGELNCYDLYQNRYDTLHHGSATLIFVTEKFSKSKQVKLDDPKEEGIEILKLNQSTEFLTGIYPYYILNSTFSPIDGSKCLKSTSSVQEWCGNAYSQLNLTDKGYRERSFSYFESEGDVEKSIDYQLLEDEIWLKIRIHPEKIPQGKQKIIRSSVNARLKHLPIEAMEVEITNLPFIWENKSLMKLEIKSKERTLKIFYHKQFPHQIEGWEETSSEFGLKPLTSVAKLKKSIRLPYWELHRNQDRKWRDSLLLRKD